MSIYAYLYKQACLKIRAADLIKFLNVLPVVLPKAQLH